MPPTRSSSIAPDLDALELTLVRSIENIRKTLPQNRRQSQDLSTIAFSLGQNTDTIALHTTEKNRGLVASAESFRIGEAQYDDDPLASVGGNSVSTGPSWKNYIRESEALALELQMESVRQDMRDLAGARQRRYQDLTGHGGLARRKLRRVSEALPQNRASYLVSRSNSEGSRGAGLMEFSNNLLGDPAVGHGSRVSNGEGPEVGSMGNSSMITYSNPFKSSLSSKRLRVQNPGNPNQSILPTTSEIRGPPPRHDRSRSTANTRSLSITLPVSSNVGIATPKKADLSQKSYHKGESSADPGGSHQNRHSSEGARTGRKPQNFVEKKVRFAEKPVGIEKRTPAPIYGRKSILINNSSTSSLTSWSHSSRSFSITSASSDEDTSDSRSRSSSSTDDDTSGSDLHSFSSSDDEEPIHATALKPLRTPLGPLDPTGKRIPQTSSALKNTQKRSTVTKEAKERDQNKPGGLKRSLSTNSKITKTTPKENHPLGVPGEKPERPGKSPVSNVGGHKATTSTTNHPLPQHANPHQFNLNKGTNTSIRSLLRKHSGNLLNKFSWRSNKTGGLLKPLSGTREELACIRCRELFDANLLIQVPAKCLHLYCKSCLKGMFSVLRWTHLFPNYQLTSLDPFSAMFTQALNDPRNACPVRCCESNLIDVSLAADLLGRKNIARYKALLAESSTRTRWPQHQGKRSESSVSFPHIIRLDYLTPLNSVDRIFCNTQPSYSSGQRSGSCSSRGKKRAASVDISLSTQSQNMYP